MILPTVVPDFVEVVADPKDLLKLLFSTLTIFSPFLVANLSELSALDLIRKCTQKSENWNETWEEFEGRFGKQILKYLYQEFRRLTHGHYATEYDEIIKDLQQDVFIKLLSKDGQALRNFKGKTENSFLAYLHTISRNIVINFFKNSYEKRVKRYAKLEEAYSSSKQRIEPLSNDTIDSIDNEFLQDFIISSLKDGYHSRQPERDLLVFKLFFFEGCSPEQIITTCDIDLSISGIETLVSRMKKYLRKSIEK